MVPNAACTCETPAVKKQRRYQQQECKCVQQSHHYKNPYSNKKPRQLRIHQAVAIVQLWTIPISSKNRKEEQLSSQERKQLSHQCGRGVCCNPEHIFKEPEKVNLDRRKCHKKLKNYENPHCTHGADGEQRYCTYDHHPIILYL